MILTKFKGGNKTMEKIDAYTISIPVDSNDTNFEYRIKKLINAK